MARGFRADPDAAGDDREEPVGRPRRPPAVGAFRGARPPGIRGRAFAKEKGTPKVRRRGCWRRRSRPWRGRQMMQMHAARTTCCPSSRCVWGLAHHVLGRAS